MTGHRDFLAESVFLIVGSVLTAYTLLLYIVILCLRQPCRDQSDEISKNQNPDRSYEHGPGWPVAKALFSIFWCERRDSSILRATRKLLSKKLNIED